MKKIKFTLLAVVVLSSIIFVPKTYADDLNVSSSVPKLYFDDTSTAGNDWLQSGNENFFYLREETDFSVVMKFPKSSIAANSFITDTSGDISLADGSVFIDKSENRLGIGTAIPQANLDITGRDVAIFLHRTDDINYTITTYNDALALGTLENEQLGLSPNAPMGTLVVGHLEDPEQGNSVRIGGIELATFDTNATLYVGGSIEANSTITSKFEGEGTESVYKLLTLSANDTDGTGPSEAAFVLNNVKAGKSWLFRTIDDGKAFTATLGGTGGAEFKVLNPTGNYHDTELYLGNGAKNVGGVWYNASSRKLKENIHPLSTKEAMDAFKKLQPVTYNYKTDKTEKVVGFIAEDVPGLVAINSRDGLSAMDMVALLTKVTQEQEKSLTETKVELKKAQEKIAKLEKMQKRLAKVESLLTNLALETFNKKEAKISMK
jgi:hypothetical protein